MERTVKKILVATDFSENAHKALEYGLIFARQLGARLYLTTVNELSPIRWAIHEGLLREDDTDETVQQRLKEFTNQKCADLLKGADCSDVDLQVVILSGDAATEIVNYARTNSIDLIVMGRRGFGRNPLIKEILGSVSDKVIRRAPCPVMVVNLR